MKSDLRNYIGVVKEALADLRAKEPVKWGWRIKSVNKGKILLRWGYIPDTDISIRLEEEILEGEPDVMLCARMDDRYPVNIYEDDADDLFITIGDRHWHDAPSIEKGLRMIISNIGYIARTQY